MNLTHGDTFTLHGVEFTVSIESDDESNGPNYAPWDREDGHGPVRTVNNVYGHPNKRAGERVLHSTRSTVWLYDWQEACNKARTEGWDAEPIGQPGRVQRAVQADFDRLQAFLNDQWSYVGVCIEGSDGSAASLWGIESDADDYITEVAHELASECVGEPSINAGEMEYASWLA